MDLKELLGDDYKEDLTADDISGIFERKFLATGKYENKEKEKLMALAEELNVPFSQLARQAIKQFLDQVEDEDDEKMVFGDF